LAEDEAVGQQDLPEEVVGWVVCRDTMGDGDGRGVVEESFVGE
jgi:hypothetical protein